MNIILQKFIKTNRALPKSFWRGRGRNFSGNRFGLCCKYTPESNFLQICRPFRRRCEAPPKQIAPQNQSRSARAGAPRGWPKRGSTPVRFNSVSDLLYPIIKIYEHEQQ